MSMGDTDSFNTGFILLTLKKQIQKILEQYPDDGQILKELIQNAEDAGASEIKFLYDKGSYGSDSLYHKELEEFQGPALYAGNTAEFTEDDWKGIRMLNDSVKEDDPLKVGRFGLGFKSVFHMTDLPGLMSGNYVAYLDPHQVYFREGMNWTSSYRWNIGQEEFRKFKDQFEPFKVKLFDASESSIRNGHYTRTLFRFPFRKEDSQSDLSKTVYNDRKVSELFESFKFDAHTVLMFLKSLEKIELYERNNAKEDPRILFRVQITPDCLEEVRKKRKEFISKLTSGNPIETTYPITIETTDFSNASSPKVAVSSWLVSQCFGGNVEGFNDVKRLPWVGIAAPLGSKPAGAHGIKDNKETVTVKGQVFCFLPLPLPEDGESVTKFPFHVNGYFAVDHNRRHLKWPTPGSGKDQDVLWNQYLLKQMLPKALFEVLKSMLKELKTKPLTALKMIEDSSESRSIQLRHLYSTLRSMDSIDHQWKKVMENLPLELIKKLDFFYTESQSGRWLTSEKVIFNTLSTEGVAETKQHLILRILQAAGTNIVNVPSEFLQACRSLSLQVSPISSDLVAQGFKKIQDSQSFTKKEVYMIIEYIGVERIVGLKLLPLADGTMTYFTNKPTNQEQCVYIETPEFLSTLLPRQERQFAEMDNDGRKFLKKIAEKGHTQLLYLNKDSVAALLPNVLPSTWGSPAEIWNPGSGDHPTTKWLEQIWIFLYTYYPRGIEKFKNLHLLPDTDKSPKQMIRVAFDYPIIAPSGKSNGLSNAMLIILEKVHCRVLRSLPGFVRQHPCIANYIKPTMNSSGLLDILENVHNQDPRQFTTAFQQLDGREIKALKEFLVSNHLNNISSQNKQFLRTLPLFPIWKNPNQSLARLDQNLKGSPKLGTYFSNIRQHGSFLDLSDEISKKIAECCSVQQMEIREYVSNYLLTGVSNSFYSTEEVQKIMKEVITKYHELSRSIPDLSVRVSGLSFLLDSSSTLHTPNELFDPLDELLRSMLDDKDRFPHPDWRIFSSTLKLCGLKGCADVNADELYPIAKEIERKGKPSNQSEAFLRYISKYPDKLQQFTHYSQLGEHLKNVCWVECSTSKPNAYPKILGWKGESAKLVKPSELKSDKFSALVGSELYAQPRHFKSSPKVTAYFGWDATPDIDIVLRQLRNVISCYTDSEKSTFFNVVKGIYEYFQALGSHQVKAKLFGSGLDAWVWQGNGFVKTSSVVLNTPTIDMRPYVYGLPRELKYLEGFFSECGVEKDCSQMKVLEQIKEYHDYRARQSEEVKRDLNIALAILDHINEQVVQGRLDPDDLDLLIPVHSDDPTVLKLMPREECIYYDVEWLKGHFDVTDTDIDEEELNPLHKKISIDTAENLKIPTFTSHVLEPEELDMSYGQSEPLTRRLNNLLKEYTDGFAVPKELIQNADDAGATEVKFLYDERKNEDAMTCLIGDGMKECQGPAFWAYNNASFADEDFENIVKLSGATKEEQTEKIGRFGLGFNAVYNLTDVPSFVSGHNFVVFDPHTTYLGKVIKDKSKPGIKLDMDKKTKKLKAFKNQFKPFNQVFGCDLNPEAGHLSFKGTLFRFPLRTLEQAQKSEISKIHYSGTEMKELIKMLEKGADSLLLFTQNILKISVYHMKEDAKSGDDMMEIFTVTKAPVTFLKELAISKDLSTVAKNLPKAQKKLIQQSNILGEAGLAIRNGTPDPKGICNSMIIKIGVKQGNQEGFQLDGSTRECLWLITAAMGRNRSLEKAKKDKTLVPVGGAAIKIQKNGNKYRICELENGQLFCFLPLPVPIKLPIHLNGTFALTSNRRSLYEKTMDDKKADYALWNESLLEDAVCNAFIRLLVELTNICDTSKYNYHALWPQCHQTSEMLKHFTMTVYKKIATDENIKVFSDANQWAALKDVFFLEEVVQNSEIGPTALKILQEVENRKGAGSIATEIPSHIRSYFKHSSCEVYLNDRTLDLHTFFGNVFFPHLERFSAEDRNFLIRHALLKNDKVIDEMLKKSSCIPVQCTSDLKVPSDLIHPKGKIGPLYTPEDEKFPELDGFIASQDSKEVSCILQAFVRVGMMKDTLPWEDVLERAQTIPAMSYEEGLPRSKAVLNYIGERIKQSTEKELSSTKFEKLKEEFIQTEFCPVLSKPKGYQFTWKGDNYISQMLAPCDLYPEKSMQLVGSVSPIIGDILPKVSTYSYGRPRAMTVEEFLGLQTKDIPIDNVFEQLDIIAGTNMSATAAITFLEPTCRDIYQYFSDKYTNGDTDFVSALSAKRFLFVDGTFVSAKQCDFELSFDAKPYLYKLPNTYKSKFEIMMKAVGVEQKFPPKCFVEVLQKMENELRRETLGKEQVKLAVNLLDEFSNSWEGDKRMTVAQIQQKYGSLYIPNNDRILQDASTLCYNPKVLDWMEIDSDMKFTHPSLSQELASKLGLNTIRDDFVNRHSIGIPFGQKEDLTTRIKGILQGYPCDVEILKEFVQNADDAEATEIHFVLDTREHPKKRVISDSWQKLQGPALLVYNNKPFTEKDIEGIQNLGTGSKGQDPSKTGQYGVGFNCVYHLTDVPTFLTTVPGRGKLLCALDPCRSYVEGADSNSPGRMFEYNLKKKFPDVFSPYMENVFDTSMGTVFRFPLRLKASENALAADKVGVDEIKKLFKKFIAEMSGSLLFLNSVMKISVSEMDCNGQLVDLYKIKAEIPTSGFEELQKFQKTVKGLSEDMKQTNFKVSCIPYQDFTYQLVTEDSKECKEIWRVTKCVGFSEKEKVPEIIDEAFKQGNLGLLPKGGIAVSLTTLAKVNYRPTYNGRLYCFLPLPLKTKLPIHVNGHFALDHENRRALWNDEAKGYRTAWNMALFTGTLARAYVKTVEQLREIVEKNELSLPAYNQLFPTEQQEGEYVKLLVKAFYRHIGDESIKLLPVVRQNTVEWHAPNGGQFREVYFDDLCQQIPQSTCEYVTSFIRKPLKPESEIVREVLLACGMNLLNMPTSIQGAFFDAEVKLDMISPDAVLQFFKTARNAESSCRLKIESLQIPLEKTHIGEEKNYKALMDYCAKSEPFLKNPEEVPLLLCYDYQLRVFCTKTPIFVSACAHIVNQKHAGKFMHKSIIHYFDTCPSPSLKEFTIQSFVELLPDSLTGEEYKSKENVTYVRKSKTLPNEDWLKSVWKFLSYSCQKANDKKEEKLQESKILQPLNEWALVPAESFDRQPILVPLEKAAMIFDTDSGGVANKDLNQIFQKLGFPKPDYNVVEGGKSKKLLKALIGNIDKPDRVIIALEHLMKTRDISGNITDDDATEILTYLTKQLEEIKKVPNCRAILQRLPLYLDVNNRLISLEGKTVYILSGDIPKDGLSIFDDSLQVVFLQDCTTKTNALYQYMNCSCNAVDEIYLNVIFPNFELLPQKAQMAHLDYLSYYVIGKRLLNGLKNLAFIRHSKGHLAKAQQFVDEEVSVLRLFEPENLLPKEWSGYRWSEFLKKIGLRCSPKPDQLIKFAREVEATAPSIDHCIAHEKAEAILESISLQHYQQHRTFLQEIKSIKFIPQHKVSDDMNKLYSQYGLSNDDKLPFICFDGSVLQLKDTIERCWTSAPILGSMNCNPNRWNTPPEMGFEEEGKYRKRLFQELGIKPLTVALVIDHLEKLCGKLQSEMKDTYKTNGRLDNFLIQKTMTNCLNFLMNSKEENELAKLKQIPMIPVKDGQMLVKASQIAIKGTATDEIEPFTYTLPLKDLGKYADFIRNLGGSEGFTVGQYAYVLKESFSNARGGLLLPNAIEDVLRATKGLFKLIKEGSSLEILPELYLMGNDTALHLSNSLIYNDNVSWRNRLSGFGGKFFAESKELCLQVEEIHACLMKFPDRMKMKKLSNELQESLDESLTGQVEVNGSNAVKTRLQTEEFTQGLKRVIYHQLQGSMSNTPTEHLDHVIQAMQRMEVYEVPNLKTVLVGNGQTVPESTASCDCFAEKCTQGNGPQAWKIYIDTSMRQESTMALMSKLADIISEITTNILQDNCLSSRLHWVITMLSMPASEIPDFLDSAKVLRFGAGDARPTFIPKLGSYVPKKHHGLLRDNITDFSVNDYVAYELYDESDNLLGAAANGGNQDPVYLYAKIRGAIATPEEVRAFERNYSIDIGEEDLIIVSVVRLYKFMQNNDNELVLYEGNEAEQPPKDIKDTFDEITKDLEEAWKLPEQNKKAVIRRLMRKWHPDKNPRNEEYATEVCKYLLNEIKRLKEGRPRPPAEERHSPKYRPPPETFEPPERDFYENAGRRARTEREDRQRYEEAFRQHYARARPGRCHVPPTFKEPNPQPAEARRWLRQAEHDLEAAPTDNPRANEWVCFKCHQAAEKALRGARYAVDADWNVSSEITVIASGIGNQEIQQLARRLQELVGSSSKMCYPDRHNFNGIPHDYYSAEMSKEALAIAEKIVEKCRLYINERI